MSTQLVLGAGPGRPEAQRASLKWVAVLNEHECSHAPAHETPAVRINPFQSCVTARYKKPRGPTRIFDMQARPYPSGSPTPALLFMLLACVSFVDATLPVYYAQVLSVSIGFEDGSTPDAQGAYVLGSRAALALEQQLKRVLGADEGLDLNISQVPLFLEIQASNECLAGALIFGNSRQECVPRRCARCRISTCTAC